MTKAFALTRLALIAGLTALLPFYSLLAPLSVAAEDPAPAEPVQQTTEQSPPPTETTPPPAETTPEPETVPTENPTTYTFNPETNKWESDKWVWDRATQRYIRYVPPAVTATNQIDETGPDSTNGIDNNNNSTGTANLTTNASINNLLNMLSQSGNAGVMQNTLGGSATSGNALALANLINILQSNTNLLQPGNLTTFSSDIYGDVQGDIMIDPGALSQSDGNGGLRELDINHQANGQINNTLVLDAYSGNTDVLENTTAGNATTGTATAMANVVNVINSILGSGQSFMGMVNIHGNFDGDILMPPGALEALLASNFGAGDTSGPASSLNIDLTDNQVINNELNLNAGSGNATVEGNTTAGSATTGDAQTNLTVLNLTGRQVIGKNALLVFVNVMGEWVGMIVNAPEGSTAAALGGGLSENSLLAQDTDINSQTNSSINNDIMLNAFSGDATVARNTTAGNATTGNASASVNLANIIGSNFSLSDWLGVLFINVFGNWNGSFGVDTAAGEPPAGAVSGVQDVKVFQFVPANTSGGSNKSQLKQVPVNTSGANQEQASNDSFAGLFGLDTPAGGVIAASGNANGSSFSLVVPAIGGFLSLALLGTDRYLSKKKQAGAARTSAIRRAVVHSRSHIWNR